jgi:hypothetical protein
MNQGHNGGPPLRDAGWYATHRDMLNHPIVGIGKPVKPADPTRGSLSRFEAWHWLIANAAYKAQPINNTGKVMDLQPGQVMGARSYLAREWNWSEMTVRWFLKTLLDEHMITLATDKLRNQPRTNTANIITLCNYLKYQLGEDEQKSVNNQQTSSQQPASNQPATSQQPQSNKETNKQDKKVYGHEGQNNGRDYWANAMAVPGAYNPDEGVLRDKTTGALTLINGTRQLWLERFGDAESLDLALMQAANYVQPNAYKSLKVQVEAQLAKQLAGVKERGKRYEAAKQSKPQTETPEQRKKRLFAQAQEEMRGRK